MTGSLSLTKEAFNQLIKGCHLAMHNAALLADENIALHAANQKQKQKWLKSVSSISQGGVLTVQEGCVCTENLNNRDTTVKEQSTD